MYCVIKICSRWIYINHLWGACDIALLFWSWLITSTAKPVCLVYYQHMFVVEKSTWNKLLFFKITYKCKYGFIHKRYTNSQKRFTKDIIHMCPIRTTWLSCMVKNCLLNKRTFFIRNFSLTQMEKFPEEYYCCCY